MNINNVYKNCNNTYIILLVFIIFKETLRETAWSTSWLSGAHVYLVFADCCTNELEFQICTYWKNIQYEVHIGTVF